jgi:polyphosphate kinase 2 (PPK2 family)
LRDSVKAALSAVQDSLPACFSFWKCTSASAASAFICLTATSQFEDYLTRQGTIILKFFLHVSRKEQKKRFLERLDRADKHWKFSMSDVHERKFWGDYMHAFEEAIRATATKHAPWYVVPADNKWFTRLLVAAAIVEAMEKLDLAYPTIDVEKKKELQTIRTALIRAK